MARHLLHPAVNERALSRAEVPSVQLEAFRETVIEAIRAGGRLLAFFGGPPADEGVHLTAVLALPHEGRLGLVATTVRENYEALTPDCPQAHLFEREVAEQCGVVPRGHPWLKPVRSLPDERSDFYRVEGEEIHEVAVGPVHAGVIEPGHFRFQCHGESVHHLEIALGYQHRGIEAALPGGPDRRTIHLMETAAGDTTIGHTLAACQAIEALSRAEAPPRALALRGVALELERIANHVGDLGALAGDVGFLPAMSYLGRIRGDVLNLTAEMCGSRFGRGLVRPGGVSFDVSPATVERIRQKLGQALRDAEEAIRLMWNAPSVVTRFEGAGTVTRADGEAIGLVGPPARACGIDRDTRKDTPFGIYRFTHIPTVTWDRGDVFGRAHVRHFEIARSAAFVDDALANLPAGPSWVRPGPLRGDQVVVSLVEGWRGEICHVALTGPEGRFARYKIVDPSFHNWFGLALALRGEQISDFPLCNKSFNLSYCGHDL